MSDLKISQLPALSGSDLASADQLAVVDSSASQTSKLTVGDLIANGVTLINDNTIPGAKILFDSGSIATAALADSGVTTVKIAADAITSAKIADNVIVALASTLPTSGGFIGQLALDTDDNSLYVWSGTTWLNTKAPSSVNAFSDTTAGIVNITTTVSSGTATITASIDNTASAAQFLAGPVGAGGAVGYRTIDGGDLPTATTTSKGGVIVNGGGLTLSTDTIQIDNSVTASSTKHLVTYDANGLITGGSAIASSDLPVATSSAKGAVIASDGLAVDASGNLSIDNTVTAGTYTKVTVTSKGVVSAGDTLAAADIPDHSAAKLTSGTIGSSLIANSAVTADKLADSSTVKFGGALGSDNVTIFPDGDFKGQLFWDETSLDLYVYTGSAFIPITVLSGNLVNAGTYNASTNLVSSVTTAGSSAGFSAGSALPAPVGANLNHYVVVETSGTGSGAAPAVALAPPDMLLSNGVGTEYRLIDVSNAIAGQTAANISFIASGTIAATDVQAALQEVDTEKLAIAGGTMTGDLNLGTSTNVVFEGSSADDYETTLTVTNPTADRTITLPNVTGTVVTTGDTGSVTSTMIADGAIVNADINAGAEIAVSKLANGTARQLLQTDSGGSGVEFTSNVDVPGTLDVTSAATFDSTVAVTGLLSANGKLAYPAGTAAAVSLYSGTDTDTGIYSPGSNEFGIATAGTSRIVVDASGNAGIGITNPAAKTHISNSYSAPTGGHDGNLALIVSNSSTSNSYSGIGISAGNNAGSFIHFGDTDDDNVGALNYFHDSNSFTFVTNTTEKMCIDSSGNVEIGTSTSRAGLTVAKGGSSIPAAGANTASAVFGNDADDAIYGLIAGANTSGTGYLQVQRTDGNATVYPLAIQPNGGNVGINNTAPLTKLDVVGSTTNGSGTVNTLRLKNGGTSANDGAKLLFTSGTSTDGAGIAGQGVALNSADLVFYAGGNNEKMRILSSGNVGIGTESALQLLHVSSGDNNDSGAVNIAIGGTTNNGRTALISKDTSTPYDLLIRSSQDSSFDTALAFETRANNERMRIDSSGNVGIGLGNPSDYHANANRLVINGGMTFANVNGGNIYFADSSTGTGEYVGQINYNHGPNNMQFVVNNSEAMQIDSSQRLLIGNSSSPTSGSGQYGKLVVTGNTLDSTGDGRIVLARGKNVGQLSNGNELGGVYFTDSLGSAFAAIRSEVGDTPGADDFPGTLKFFTTPNNSPSLTERLRIENTGRTLIQNTIGLEVTGTDNNANIGVFYALNNNATADAAVAAFATGTNSTATSNVLIKFGMNGYGSGQGQINANGTGQVAFGTFSDRRLKENIVDLPSQWQNIKNLRPVEFDFIESQGGEHQIGFIAQEFETVYPDAVGSQPAFNGADENSTEERLTITDWSKTDTRLVKALQEAMTRIEQLEAKVAALEAG